MRRPASAIDDLLVVPMVALLAEPMTATELASTVTADGLEMSGDRAEAILARASALGLARVAEYQDGDARYVATSLGQRSAASLASADPELAVGLQELERLRSELLATVGHELRTPLTAIRTSVGLLLDPGIVPSPDQRQQLLSTIGRSADRMQRLLTELLDLARLRSGRAELQRAAFDARDVARDVAAAVEPMAAARSQRVRMELPERAVRMVGDRRRLEQALLNLVANAQKFSPAGAEIDLSLARTDDGAVRWTVVDRGPGIGAEEQARLFERFFVGTSDGNVAGGGAGIGLPTALAIAQGHGGTIEVDSEVGRGSIFHLVIPTGGRT
ncbi:MAG TPA: HAMP domain-containing sensor histidine kinase [Candidatus Limnocylindria bacterium]|nr:HAMP domain-containing sensor histidine kinase [Candidatus Limnocylindria bacterium]